MKYSIAGEFPQVLNAQITPGEVLRAVPGRLVSMSYIVDVKLNDGALSGLRRVFSETWLSMSEYSVQKGTGLVSVGPPLPGKIYDVDLSRGEWLVQKDAFLACAGGTSVSKETQKKTGDPMMGPEGLILLRLSGSGTAFFCSVGGLESIDLNPDDRYTVSTSHAIAWQSTVKYTVRSVRGSEGQEGDESVTDFKGPGKVVIQHLCAGNYAEALSKFRPSGKQA